MAGTRPGAARSEVARLAILEATARLFAVRGYEQLSIEGIATEAGVGKQTIYRWWHSKSDLVSECLLEDMLLPVELTIPTSGTLRADLTEWLDRVLEILQTPPGLSLMTSLIAAATANDEIGLRLRDSLCGDSSPVGRIEKGIAAGEIVTDSAAEIGEALIGIVLLKAIGGAPINKGDGARIVNALLPRTDS